MSKRLLDDPQYWRDRAEEARMHADEMKDPETKHMMLRIAESHERQAQLLKKSYELSKPNLNASEPTHSGYPLHQTFRLQRCFTGAGKVLRDKNR
jgi:hypothetical protein